MAPLDPPVDLDLLLDSALATGGETASFDFKEVLDFANNGEHKLKLLKAIGAFCNTDHGGHIILGVANDRRVIGVTPALAATFDQTRVQRIASEHFAPSPRLQVRHHQRKGQTLVVVEVRGFTDVPSVVKKSETQGNERLQAGTFLTRTIAAESALVTAETEVRALCDAIAARRSRQIAEAVASLRPVDAQAHDPRKRAIDGLVVIKAEADRIGRHARELNIELHNADRQEHLPLLFRPALLESSLPAVLSEIGAEGMLMEQLSLLRTAAAAADEHAKQLMSRGGDARPLVHLVLQVLNAARFVSDTLGRRLVQLTANP